MATALANGAANAAVDAVNAVATGAVVAANAVATGTVNAANGAANAVAEKAAEAGPWFIAGVVLLVLVVLGGLALFVMRYLRQPEEEQRRDPAGSPGPAAPRPPSTKQQIGRKLREVVGKLRGKNPRPAGPPRPSEPPAVGPQPGEPPVGPPVEPPVEPKPPKGGKKPKQPKQPKGGKKPKKPKQPKDGGGGPPPPIDPQPAGPPPKGGDKAAPKAPKGGDKAAPKAPKAPKSGDKAPKAPKGGDKPPPKDPKVPPQPAKASGAIADAWRWWKGQNIPGKPNGEGDFAATVGSDGKTYVTSKGQTDQVPRLVEITALLRKLRDAVKSAPNFKNARGQVVIAKLNTFVDSPVGHVTLYPFSGSWGWSGDVWVAFNNLGNWNGGAKGMFSTVIHEFAHCVCWDPAVGGKECDGPPYYENDGFSHGVGFGRIAGDLRAVAQNAGLLGGPTAPNECLGDVNKCKR